jgi:hypothetical protein
MDEVFGYFPPTANPPSKTPMLTLLKQARAYGLGILLATQNPVDLDYKGLSNTGTWFLGRLQTERDKARVLEGLEGASAAAGSSFDRGKMEATLAALGNRVFLMNNVHEDEPVVFQSRWCLSYLRGPLTRGQIQKLMADRKADSAAATPGGPVTKPKDAAAASPAPRSLVSRDVEQVFLTRATGPQEPQTAVYQPALLGLANIRFVDTKAGVDAAIDVTALSAIGAVGDNPWAGATIAGGRELNISEQATPGVEMAPLPAELGQKENYARWQKALAAHLYRQHTLTLWRVAALKEFSKAGETEGEFRVRIAQRLREIRDAAVAKLRDTYGSKGAGLDEQIQKARERVAREKSQFQTQAVDTAVSLGSSILRALFGRKLASVTNVRGATSTARRASRTARQRGDVQEADKHLAELLEKRAKLEDEFDKERARVQADYENVQVEPYPIRPRKSDVAVQKVVLAWVR